MSIYGVRSDDDDDKSSSPLKPCDHVATSEYVSIEPSDSVATSCFGRNIRSDSSLVTSSDSSIQSEISLVFDAREDGHGDEDQMPVADNKRESNASLIRHANVGKHHGVAMTTNGVHLTWTHELLSQHLDLLESRANPSDTNHHRNNGLSRSMATICMARDGLEHVYIANASTHVLKVNLGASSQCENKLVWMATEEVPLARRGRPKDNMNTIVRAMLPVDPETLVTAEQSRCGRHTIKVWQRRQKSQDPRSYKCETTLPKRYSWDHIRRSLVATNYVQVRRHHARLWTEHVDAIASLAFCKAHGILYSASWDRALKAWRLADGRCVQSVARAHEDAINAVIVCERSAAVFTGGADGAVRVWSPACDGKSEFRGVEMAASLEGHRAAVNALALSADGRALYSGSADGTIRAWDGRCAWGRGEAAVLIGHRGAVLCLAAAPGGVLCSGSADRTVRVWWTRRMDAAAMQWACVRVLRGHAAPVKCISARAATAHPLPALIVLSGASDGHFRAWTTGPAKTIPN